MVAAFVGHEVPLSQANLCKDDPAYDEESPPSKWFHPSDSDNLDKPVEELPSRLRVFRKYNYMEYNPKGWGRFFNLIMYICYVLIAALIQADNATPTPDDVPHARTVGLVISVIYNVLAFVNSVYVCFSVHQTIAWAGLYKAILWTVLLGGTAVMLSYSFQNVVVGTMQIEYGLLIVMAGFIFIDQRLIDPMYENLYCYYHGAISKDEVKDGVRPIAGISNSALQKIAANACKALKIPDEASKTVQKVLDSHRIREGNEEALDDWTYTIYKLTYAVSFAPIFCVSKSKISSSQCQQLTLQMLLYLRVYMDTGKIQDHEEDVKRTAPLSLLECLVAMTKMCLQAPVFFLVGIIPRTISGVVMSSMVPVALGNFTNSAVTGNRKLGLSALYTFAALIVVGPILNMIAVYVEALFTKKMVSVCRRKMLKSSLKGGTKFGEKFRPGKLIDSFSSQLVQFELYTFSFFVTILPQIFQMLAGIVTAALKYPPAVFIFVSLVPLIFSVDYFEDRASRASAKRAQTDGTLSGKVASAVECRDAIRAGDASDWVMEDMKELLDRTDRTHFNSFFRSGLSEGYISVMGGIYMLLIVLPLGLSVVNGALDIGSFMTVQGAAMSIVQPIYMFGIFTKLTTQTNGPIQSVWELIDDSLNEEPSSKSSSTVTSLKKLANALSIKGIKFRYAAKLPDVIKGVNIELSPGTYTVICGESGSGKSTVLSLLMRFQTPYEGTIEWDGTNIYGSSLDSYRENVGVMFQRTMIYQGTIRDNILFGQPNVEGAVEQAARAAEIAEVIERLPDGYDTVIGGDALAGMSGGQLQRVCMARALYKKPSVLLLDEATSALDAETEHSIIETLCKLRDTEGLTLVSVSHHPSTAVKADKIVVLERGVIAEEGKYDELVSREGGIFKRIVEAGEEVQE